MLTPIPTAFGDMSAAMVLGWQLAPALLPLVAGLSAAASPGAPWLWSVPIAVVVAALLGLRSGLGTQAAWSLVPLADRSAD